MVTGAAAETALLSEETFGPVAPIVRVGSLDEAIELANSTRFGLGANVYTRDLKTMLRCMRELKAGTVWFNDPLTDNDAGPFGGFKQSGLGRELGREGLEAFQETKHVHIETEIEAKDWWYPRTATEGDGMEPERRAGAAPTRTLRNYIGGGWVEAAARRHARGPQPGDRRAARAGAALGRRRRRRRRARRARGAARRGAAVAPQKRARAVIALREALWERREEIARLVTEDMGKTLDDARGEVVRGIESTEAACGDPAPAQGREPRGRRLRRRRRARGASRSAWSRRSPRSTSRR